MPSAPIALRMQLAPTLAQQLRQVFFGGNWTAADLQAVLKDVSQAQATAQVPFTQNTILVLTFHIHYYLREVAKVLNGGALEAHDKFSFEAPELAQEGDWDAFREMVLQQAEEFAQLVEAISEESWPKDFTAAQYGSYYRNIQGIIEHTHYHLGQIALLKKAIAVQ